MRKWKFILMLGAVFAALLAVAEPIEADKALMVGNSEKNPLEYRVGDELKFTIDLKYTGADYDKGDYTVIWKRGGDDGIVRVGHLKVDQLPYTFKDKFTKPGFIRYRAELHKRGGGKTVVGKLPGGRKRGIFFDGSAGANIRELMPQPEPADFDEFWESQRARLAKVPMKVTMQKVKALNGGKAEVYSVQVSCAGSRPVTGYLYMPVDRSRKYPARVRFYGWSKDPKAVQKPFKGADLNEIQFSINAHGYELNQTTAYYEKYFKKISSNGKDYAFDPIQNSDRLTAYFNGMALRVMRALEFVKNLPEWDGKNLIVSGGSQAGLQSLWGAGLDKDVTQVEVWKPWCCDLAGHAKALRMASTFAPAYTPALDYYDGAFHAKRIKCPVNIRIAGLGDFVCPPAGMMAMFNNLRVPAKIRFYQGEGHGGSLSTPGNPPYYDLSK